MKLPNVQIKKILYTTDLSENAVHAYAYAVSLADTYGASISILHVLSEYPGEDFVTAMINADTMREIKKRHYSEARDNLIGKKRDHVALKEILEAFSEEAVQGEENSNTVADEVLIKSGTPADVILQTADEIACDLIVLGTRGQGMIAEMLIGSTAKRVIRESKIPVLVVRLP